MTLRQLNVAVADAFDVVHITGHGVPRQPDRVFAGLVLEPWDDVEMEMPHGLPCGFAAAVQKVDAVRAEPVLSPYSDPLGEMGAGSQVLGGDVEQVG